MEGKFERIKDAKIENGKLNGFINLSKDKADCKVVFDIEEEKEKFELKDFNQIVDDYKEFIDDLLDGDQLKLAVKSISREITDSSYSQSDYRPTEEDYQKLEEDLVLSQVNFYSEDAVFVFDSNEIFKETPIYCQIERSWEIVDINVG